MMILGLLILLMPLLGALTSGPLSKSLGCVWGMRISVGLSFGATVLAGLLIAGFCQTQSPYSIPLFSWIHVGDLILEWRLYLDAKALTMMGVVTAVSSVVHLYALSYMAKDKGQGRFMSYLSLFTFMMLWLVMAGDLVQLFLGWEGVGLCSYLLIGFWFEKKGPTDAALKSFLVNRIGDMFLILGLVGLYWIYGSFSLETLAKSILQPMIQNGVSPTFVGVCLLLGAMAKSAQIGFHIWLPDAMEGPTPASALIHAATMVTAGIFLLLRLEFFLDLLPFVLSSIALVGGVTALFASIMALFQRDIKRIIAYSTCSQLGYMMMGVGVSAYGTALFHLVTHAFFKSLLFLGAGSVVHLFKGEKDLKKMGGLGFKDPLTYGAMAIGLLSLVGFPYFAGFFSKDRILEQVYNQTGWMAQSVFILGLSAAFFTSLYAMRLMIGVFHGGAEKDRAFGKPAPLMLVSLGILSVCGLVVGYMPRVDWGQMLLNLQPVPHNRVAYMVGGAALLGITVGVCLFAVIPRNISILRSHFPKGTHFLAQQAHVDRVSQRLLVMPYKKLAVIWAYMDTHYLDYFGPMGAARLAKRCHKCLAQGQTGYLYHAAQWILAGLVLVLFYVWWV